jgi:DNA-binding transcriptional LysR family regulator
VSRVIRRLEHDLGVQLLIRDPSGAVLSPAGIALADQARSIFAHLDRAIDVVKKADSPRQRLRIGLVAGRMAAGELTEPILTTFHSVRSDIDLCIVELDFSDHRRALISGDIDLAIVRPPLMQDDLEITPLFTEPRLLCFPRSNSLSDADELPVDDVIDQTMLGLENAAPKWAEFWSLDDVRGEPAARVETTRARTVDEMRFSLVFGSAASTVAASTWRMGFKHPALTATPLLDVSTSEVAIATRVGGDRPLIADFRSTALHVCDQLIDLVPGARLSSA